MSLCQTYRDLSFQTWRFLEKARSISHQPLEETITDKNLIELKLRHSHDVISTTYNRRQEGVNGADWEWWFTNSRKTAWYGVRAQAKILNFKANKFNALNYKNQTNTLISDARRNGLVPLYCFYAQWPLSTNIQARNCRTFANAPESYGCSIVDAYTIKTNKGKSGSNSLTSVMANAFPWSCLVCCQGTIQTLDTNLPNRVKSFVDKVILQDSSDDIPKPQVIEKPPNHITALMHGENIDNRLDDTNLSGAIVVVENDG
ncbi:MAG: DUF6615 family protein [Pseudomonadales bacterium]